MLEEFGKNELHLQLLGGFIISLAGEQILEGQWKARRAGSLVKLLALAPGHRLHRDQLMDTLWPDSDLSAAANNFHQTLYAARRVLDPLAPGCLRLEEGFLSLSAGAGQALVVDVEQFEVAAAETKDDHAAADDHAVAIYRAALDLYPGDLLPEDRYEEWAIPRREALRQSYLGLLLHLAKLYETREAYAQGVAVLLRLLAADRSNEEAHAGLMRLYALSGQRQQALRQYQILKEALQSDLEAAPSRATEQLYAAIRSGRIAPQALAQTETPPVLPSGTVTFLFTDIEGSTSGWEQQPNAMQAAVARHQTILREAIQANEGVVFKVIGDQFQAAFRLARQGIAAAVAAQQDLLAEAWPAATGPLRVRMGLHTGAAEVSGSDYAVSHTLNRAARVMSAGFGGQILLSQECANLIRHELPEGCELKDLGEQRLKGLQVLEHLYQLSVPGLPGDFPALPTTLRPKHNLPAQLTSFIGREAETDAVRRRVREQRLVTLTGAGGTGKTRLALKAAEGLLADFPDGVFVVELAPLADPELVAQACLQSLELIQQSGTSAANTLVGFLKKRHLLLILDNCEHLLAACIQLADVLLKGCPRLHFLATSREILAIPGESALRVPSLTFPDPGSLPDAEKLLRFEAIRLFVERAEQVSSAFALSAENAAAVAQICQRLDGIPLAIELAAARARLLSAAQIAARLEHTFRLLTGGSQAILPRQQTLKATIDWSYDLLTQKERLLLQRLAVFSGGWSLEGAEAVAAEEAGSDEEGQESCAGEPLAEQEILDLLAGLVDKSLVIAEPQANGTRYQLLEMVRQYGQERLSETGCSEDLRNRHLAYYARLSGEAEPHLRAKGMIEWLERLDQEVDNLRAALEWSLSGHIVLGLKLAADLTWFWHPRAMFEENVVRVGKLLATEAQQRGDRPLAGERALQRARALRLFGWNVRYTNHKIAAEEDAFYEESAAILRTLGPAARGELGISLATRILLTNRPDPDQPSPLRDEMLAIVEQEQDKFSLSEYFYGLAGTLHTQGRLAESQALQEKSLALCQEQGDLDGMMSRSYNLSYFAWYAGDRPREDALLQQALECGQKVKNRWFLAELQVEFADRALSRGEYPEAARLAAESLGDIRDMNYLMREDLPLGTLQKMAWSQGEVEQSIRYGQQRLELFQDVISHLQTWRDITAYLYLGRAAIAQGDLSQAEMLLKKASSSELWNRYNSTWSIKQKIELLLAWIALLSQRGDHPRAARLMGAADALYRQTEPCYTPRERSEHAEALAATRSALGEQVFTAAWEEGQALTLEQAIQSNASG